MRLSISDSIKKGQERATNNIMAVGRNRVADAYFGVAKESCRDMHEHGIVAGLLNNFGKVMDSAEGASFTKSSDFGPYVMEVWPLIAAWYPDFPLKDLISVQDMDKPLAYMFFSLLKTGTAKSDTAVGDVVETPLGMRTIRGKYPTGEIVGEVISKAQVDATDGTVTAYSPLNVESVPGYVEKTRVFIGSDASTPVVSTYQANRVEDGFILFSLNGTNQAKAVISLEVATGILAGTAIVAVAAYSTNTDSPIKVNYVWNLDYADTKNIQKVKEEVVMRPMEATPRAIMLEWTLFSEYLKKTQFGQDIREDNTKRILNLLYQYQVRYILDELYDGATGTYDLGSGDVTNTTISLAITNNYALEVQVANVLKQLNVVKNQVEIASGRMEGNRIVCGQNFKSWLESLPTNIFTPKKSETGAFSGPREIGEFGTFKVYYDPFRAASEAFMTYRGENWYDATYYLGEYMPIVPTDAIALGVTVRSSFVSMEAYKYDKPSCVFKLTFTL